MPERYDHGDSGWAAKLWGQCLSRDSSTGLGEMFCPQCQGCLPSKLQVTGQPTCHQSVATSQVSPRCLPAADVPPGVMDSRHTGFLFCAGAINSTQGSPPTLQTIFQLCSISTTSIDSAGSTDLGTVPGAIAPSYRTSEAGCCALERKGDAQNRRKF